MTEITAVVVLVLAMLHLQWDSAVATRDALLLAVSVIFEEIARNIARLRRRLVDVGYHDMSGVWYLAAAAALPVSHAIVFCALYRTYVWLLHQRRLGGFAYREWFNVASQVLVIAAASLAVHTASDRFGTGPLSVGAVVAGIVTFTLVNRLLVFGMICLVNRQFRPRFLLGSAGDNGLELATLSLGGLTASALAWEPTVAVLALLPTYALHRGALVRELEVAASQDPKTGLLNAVAWQTLAKRELSRAERESQTAAVFIIDLDLFKQVNDTWGHVAGDAVLKGVGDALRDELRDYDTIGRFGGEEFVAMLPDVDEYQAAIIAERLRRRIAAIRIRDLAASTTDPDSASTSRDTLSTSIGVACYPDDGTELEQLLVGADAALYRAKQTGRNRVEFVAGGSHS